MSNFYILLFQKQIQENIKTFPALNDKDTTSKLLGKYDEIQLR